jgi:hypothetical protein
MNLNTTKIVLSFEKSQKLMQLGITQNGFFVWKNAGVHNDPTVMSAQSFDAHFGGEIFGPPDKVQTFTDTELQELIPTDFTLGITTVFTGGSANHYMISDEDGEIIEHGNKPLIFDSEWRMENKGACLIYLLEHKLIDVHECNKRLLEFLTV